MADCKLDAARAKKIVDAIRAGSSLTAAAQRARIDPETLRRWRNYGKEGQEPFAGFVVSLREAEAEFEARAVAGISAAIDAGDWKASLAWLERRRPEWRSPEAKLKAKQALQVNVGIQISPAQQSAIAAELAQDEPLLLVGSVGRQGPGEDAPEHPDYEEETGDRNDPEQ